MQFSRPAAFAAGAITALVIGSGTAVAATGGKFILGKANSANTTTTLKNPKGTPLQLTAPQGKPALKVSNSSKIANLNADRIDGTDSSAFALTTGATDNVQGYAFPLDVDEDGTGDFLAAVATCPAGTKLTGGGGDDFTTDGSLFVNSPLDKTTWMVASSTTHLDDLDSVTSYAVCYNPRGAVRRSFMRVSPQQPSADLTALAKERLAPKLR